MCSSVIHQEENFNLWHHGTQINFVPGSPALWKMETFELFLVL